MDPKDVRPDANVESAIARVLDAEHAARTAVVDAGAAATEMLETARAATRALAERTERRIRAARSAFERRSASAVAALDAAAEATLHHELGAGDLAHLDVAIAALAARLTGASDRGP
jgi:hypothetical protein